MCRRAVAKERGRGGRAGGGGGPAGAAAKPRERGAAPFRREAPPCGAAVRGGQGPAELICGEWDDIMEM